jgi:phage tail sheath protein FI
VTVCQGTVLSLAQSFNAGVSILYLNSLRQVSSTAPNNLLTLYSLSGATAPQQLTVKSYDPSAKSVTLAAPVAKQVAVGDAYLIPGGATPPFTGPVFFAQNPGGWSGSLTVAITPTDRSPTAIPGGCAAQAQQITVTNIASLYAGAVIEIAQYIPAQAGPPPVPASYGAKIYAVVAGLLPGNVVQLAAPLGQPFAPNSSVRVSEIDITISDPTAIVATSETYRALSWNPLAGNRYYPTVINANSNLAYVQPPQGEAGQIGQQPTTANGFPVTPSMMSQQAQAAAAVATATTAVNAVVTAIQAVQAAPALPLAAADPLIVALNQTQAQALAAQVPAAGAASKAAGDAAAAAQAAVTAATAAGANAAAIAPSLAAAQAAVAELPAVAAAPPASAGQIGSNGSASDGASPAGDDDYIGADIGPGARTGIQALKDIENVSIIAAPGRTSATVQSALIDQCELLRYRFAVLDGKSYLNGLQITGATGVLAQRDNYDTSYAALYVPWLQITLNNQNVYIPPSGHVVGVYAGTDNSRGVWKAPANVVVQNITGLQSYIVTGEQDILNPAGVDCIRRFDYLGTRVWGARTMSSDSSLIYVNVRRTLIFLEASIDLGTKWVVFEPNDQGTWSRVVDSVTAFLTTQWANGALFGDKPSNAFFVRCDLTTMTADDIQNGRLICLIGVSIVRPAEFVIFRIEQITGLATQ